MCHALYKCWVLMTVVMVIYLFSVASGLEQRDTRLGGEGRGRNGGSAQRVWGPDGWLVVERVFTEIHPATALGKTELVQSY